VPLSKSAKRRAKKSAKQLERAISKPQIVHNPFEALGSLTLSEVRNESGNPAAIIDETDRDFKSDLSRRNTSLLMTVVTL
jgi:hypothetical protein